MDFVFLPYKSIILSTLILGGCIGFLVWREPTKELLEREKEHHNVILAAMSSELKGRVWYDWDNEKDIDECLYKITHWMPLPAEPVN